MAVIVGRLTFAWIQVISWSVYSESDGINGRAARNLGQDMKDSHENALIQESYTFR